jgi:hypothetical protein
MKKREKETVVEGEGRSVECGAVGGGWPGWPG